MPESWDSHTQLELDTLERVLKIIDFNEETALLTEPGWETGFAAALRMVDKQVRELIAEIKGE